MSSFSACQFRQFGATHGKCFLFFQFSVFVLFDKAHVADSLWVFAMPVEPLSVRV